MNKTHKKHTKQSGDFVVKVRLPVKWRQETFYFTDKKAQLEFIKILNKDYPNVEYILNVIKKKKR